MVGFVCRWNLGARGRGRCEQPYAGFWKLSQNAVGRHRCRWMVRVLGFSSAVVGRVREQPGWWVCLRRGVGCRE